MCNFLLLSCRYSLWWGWMLTYTYKWIMMLSYPKRSLIASSALFPPLTFCGKKFPLGTPTRTEYQTIKRRVCERLPKILCCTYTPPCLQLLEALMWHELIPQTIYKLPTAAIASVHPHPLIGELFLAVWCVDGTLIRFFVCLLFFFFKFL